ncbi:uncharacterized protein LOC105432950 [Pogonomyrmex barbatus]|uniref:Uncharacterized protein LOC105432950 n=1 Tax=Pogonomyrmex barbatus TaxID=144034 RepID=A0A6I9WR25_9HYME|nr:uncharacterized protein LOC105432950 [Pogonomyrmex barbatus]
MTIVTRFRENTANDINLDVYKRSRDWHLFFIDYILDTGLHGIPVERRIFHFRKNGFKIDLKAVPLARNDTVKNNDDDHFPEFPVKDISKCIIEFSLSCIKKRFIRFVETIRRLDKIILFGENVKLVKSAAIRRSDAQAVNNSDVSIERSLDDFFDSFTLRITLPRWNDKPERNQIDVTLDDTAVVEGRGKKGGGGGGKGGGKGCKLMMMGMLMGLKLKLIALVTLKSMMMSGMSLIISMMMLKFGKSGGGGGPWKGGGGGDLKEIVLLTKSSDGGGGGCCGGGHGGDSYGAPPSSSYGPPSGGGGGYGGGGWGRSFNKQPMLYSKKTRTEIANGSNQIPMNGEVITNTKNVDYLDYQDYQEPSSVINSDPMTSKWNASSYTVFHEYKGTNISTGSEKNNLRLEPTMNVKGRNFIFNETPPSTVNVIEKNTNLMTITNQSDVNYDTDTTYMDEWYIRHRLDMDSMQLGIAGWNKENTFTRNLLVKSGGEYERNVAR